RPPRRRCGPSAWCRGCRCVTPTPPNSPSSCASPPGPSGPPLHGRGATMRPWRSPLGGHPPTPGSSSRLAVAGLVALFLAGCVKQDAPGVGIQKLAADIVFGVKPQAETPPPNLNPGQAGEGDVTTYVPDGSAAAGDFTVPSSGSFSGPNSPKPRLPRLTPLNPPR